MRMTLWPARYVHRLRGRILSPEVIGEGVISVHHGSPRPRRFPDGKGEIGRGQGLLPSGPEPAAGRQPPAPSVSEQLRRCQRAELEKKLPEVLSGKHARQRRGATRVRPALPRQEAPRRLGPFLRRRLRRHSGPGRRPDRQPARPGRLYAASAGCGHDKDSKAEKEMARLRGQALTWLRTDLVHWGKRIQVGSPAQREQARGVLLRWQRAGPGGRARPAGTGEVARAGTGGVAKVVGGGEIAGEPGSAQRQGVSAPGERRGVWGTPRPARHLVFTPGQLNCPTSRRTKLDQLQPGGAEQFADGLGGVLDERLFGQDVRRRRTDFRVCPRPSSR